MIGLDEPVFIAVLKPLLTEFHIHHRLESCGQKHCEYKQHLYLIDIIFQDWLIKQGKTSQFILSIKERQPSLTFYTRLN